MIFTRIDTRGYLGSLLKIKGVFRNISVRFGDSDFGNYGFGPGL